MASATFGRRNVLDGRRNVVESRPRPPKAAAAREIDIDRGAVEAQPRAADAARAIEPGNARKILMGALALFLIAVVLPVTFFPELRRDLMLRETFRPDLTVRVENADCSRYLLLVTSCRVRFSWPDGNARRTAESGFLVGLTSMGGRLVMPVRSSADAAVVTSGVALDHLTNRTWTLALVAGACLLLGVLMLRKLLHGRT
jgi:hypothetical protein